MEELPLGSLGSKKLAPSGSLFNKVSSLPISEVSGCKIASRCHSHNLYIVKFYTSSLTKIMLPENSSDTRINIV
jgi:hypothetical protein